VGRGPTCDSRGTEGRPTSPLDPDVPVEDERAELAQTDSHGTAQRPWPPISSQSEGYLVISERVLSRLDRDEWWRDGSRLWVSEIRGSLVHRGDPLATLMIPDNEVLKYSTRSQAQRLFRTRRLAGAERAAEAITALVQLTSSLAESGNEAGAARRTAVLVMGQAMRRAKHPAMREVMSALIRRSLSVCTAGDPFLGTLTGELDPRRSQAQSLVLDLLEECGRAAVRLGDSVVRRRWWEIMADLAGDDAWQTAAMAAGRMAQYASLVAGSTAETDWTRLASLLRVNDKNDVMMAARVGASALAVGRPSLSV
jgi:hypothetical protein